MKKYFILILSLIFAFVLPFACEDSGDDDDDSSSGPFTGTFILTNASAYNGDQFAVAIFTAGADPETATPIDTDAVTISGGTAQIVGTVQGGTYDMYAMIDADGSGLDIPTSGDRTWEELAVVVDGNGTLEIDAMIDMVVF